MHDLHITWPDGDARFTAADSPVQVGRSSTAAITLTQASVSRRHLELQSDGQRWIVVDNSTHGSYDGNGYRQPEQWVLERDVELRLGGTEGVGVQIRLIDQPAEQAPVATSASLLNDFQDPAPASPFDEPVPDPSLLPRARVAAVPASGGPEMAGPSAESGAPCCPTIRRCGPRPNHRTTGWRCLARPGPTRRSLRSERNGGRQHRPAAEHRRPGLLVPARGRGHGGAGSGLPGPARGAALAGVTPPSPDRAPRRGLVDRGLFEQGHLGRSSTPPGALPGRGQLHGPSGRRRGRHPDAGDDRRHPPVRAQCQHPPDGPAGRRSTGPPPDPGLPAGPGRRASPTSPRPSRPRSCCSDSRAGRARASSSPTT